MGFRLLCVATKPGFYYDRMHYPKGDRDNPERAGNAFALQADALRYDSEGRMQVDKDYHPVLPLWVQPVKGVTDEKTGVTRLVPLTTAELPVIDHKKTPCVVVTPKVRIGKRKLPAEVLTVAPRGWPANIKPREDMNEDRDVKIKRAGATAVEDEG